MVTQVGPSPGSDDPPEHMAGNHIRARLIDHLVDLGFESLHLYDEVRSSACLHEKNQIGLSVFMDAVGHLGTDSFFLLCSHTSSVIVLCFSSTGTQRTHGTLELHCCYQVPGREEKLVPE